MTKSEFIEQIAKYVQKYAPKYNIAVCSPIIAQACLESGYGTSAKAKYHNYFGLKYRSNRVTCNNGYFSDGSAEQNADGSYVNISTNWFSFENMEKGVEGYFQFTNTANYSNLKGVTDPETYLNNIRADGYATSLKYVSNLMRVISTWGLTKYDTIDKKEDNKMSNSSLVSYTKISPNKTSPRNHVIDTISIHCMAGNLSVETCGKLFAKSSKQASSNYGIGTDGRIALYVDEKDRSWCTSSASNDNRAITIEVANNGGAPDWPVSDAAMASLIKLCADICKRNGIKELKWQANKNLIGQVDKQNMTVHRWFAAKACIPVDSEVLTRTGWKKILDTNVGEEILTVEKDSLNLKFDNVLDIVEPYLSKTVTCQNFTATPNHRMLYWHKTTPDVIKIAPYEELLEKRSHIIRLPLAGVYSGKGIDITENLLKFIVAVQADGHYMQENTGTYYGIEFHLKKDRKINRLCDILNILSLDYSLSERVDGTVAIRVYNQNGINIVEDICEKYLSNKEFTWDFLELNKTQSKIFLNELLYWDGCFNANLYTSKIKKNRDIVQAIACMNNKASYIYQDNVCFRESSNYSIDAWKERIENSEELVSCVTVPSGAFVCRLSNGYIFLIGNCPGNYLYNKHSYIASEVNKLLGVSTTTTPTTENTDNSSFSNTYTTNFKVGDVIKLVEGATYYNGKKIPSWVMKSTLYYRGINNNGIIFSTRKTGAITGTVNPEMVVSASGTSSSSTSSTTAYKVKITATALNVRKAPNTSSAIVTSVKKNQVYTIVDTQNNWGLLKSYQKNRNGWICLDYTQKV